MTEKDWILDEKITSFESFIRRKLEHFNDNIEFYSAVRYWIPFYSLIHFLKYPEYSFLYLYPSHFYKIVEICEAFEIIIPPLPGKTKHFERSCYYFELCRSMYNFRLQHGLSPIEMAVFIYGFAPRFLSKFIKNELPKPNKIFILGASKEDVESCLSRKISENDVFLWQGCSEILPGDIILLYERAPYKRIGSIWRAVSPGFDDPFHGYPGKVYVSHAIQDIPKVTYDDLLHNKIWSKNGLIRCNMQGVGLKNASVTYEEYEALKKMFKKKDRSFDLNILPEPPPYSQFFHSDLETEKDIEEQLLEPLLEKIGYNVKKEFVRQFPIRMGRGFNYYPDYALHVINKNDNQFADFIWEAKYQIPTQKQLFEDFCQAKSYAVRLSCKGFALVSMEGVWISWRNDHFSFEEIQKYSWTELENPDIFSEIKCLFHKICKPKK